MKELRTVVGALGAHDTAAERAPLLDVDELVVLGSQLPAATSR